MTLHMHCRADSFMLYTLNAAGIFYRIARCGFVYKNPAALHLGKGGSRPPVASPRRKAQCAPFFLRNRNSGALLTLLGV